MLSDGAQAGGSLLVDDATATPIDHCQLESWTRAYFPTAELTTVPACNFGGTEFSLGASEFFKPRIGPLFNLGIKQLWRDFDQAPFGIGASLGATWNMDNQRMDLWTVNIPASIALDAERNTLVHINLGWLEMRGFDRGLTAGVGIEQALTDRTKLLAEFYAQYDQVRVAQLGLRRTLNDNANVDFLAGHQDHLATGSWFIAIGFNTLLPWMH